MNEKILKIETLEEFKQKLADVTDKIYFLAGCTDFMVSYKDELISPNSVFVDISNCRELKFIKEEDNKIHIGSITTFSELIENKIVQQHCKVLFNAAETIGAVQIRNRATIGGNVATSSPAADSVPALFVLNCKIETLKPNGECRSYPIENFFTGVKKNILQNGELIKKFIIEKDTTKKSQFYKIGPRKALAISKISIATCFEFENNIFNNVRIALGAVAPTIIRAKKTEEYLEGKNYTDELIEKSCEILSSEASPIDDIRSTAQYRRKMISTCFKIIVKELIK